MNDQQLKILIKLNQIPQPPTSAIADDSEIYQSNDDKHEEKPPFDWLKISVAILLLITLIVFSYWLLTSSEKETDASLVFSNQDTSQSTTRHQETFELEAPQAISAPSDLGKQTEIVRNHTKSERLSDNARASNENDTKEAMIIPSSKPEQKGLKLNSLQAKEKSVHVRSNHVIQAQLTTSSRKQKSINSIENIELQRGTNQTVYYFLHIRNLKGEKIFVNWYYQDKPIAKIPFSINTNDWHAHASKILTKTRLGQWRVTTMDQSGNILSEQSFMVSIRA